MGTMAIIGLILGILGVVGSAVTGGVTAATNKQSVQDTNQTNIQLTRETNAANVEQANLAYQRSLPVNQLRNLVDVGMSKQGAINVLTGGGSYTSPVLQTASADAPMMDMSAVASAFDRLGNVPSNVEQYALIDAQKQALAADTQNKIDANKRAQELHEFNMWKEAYNKNTALMLDNASSKVASALLDSGKTIEDFKDFESMLRGLGLDKDKDVRNITHIARQQLEDGVRSKFDTERARQSQVNQNIHQQNENRAAEDKHMLDMQELKQMSEDYRNSIKEHNVQDQERILRDLRARADQILAEDDLNLNQARHDMEFYTDDDGNTKLKFSRRVSERARRAWSRFAETIGIDILKDIIHGAVVIK